MKLYLKLNNSSASSTHTNIRTTFTPPLREDHVMNMHSTINETSNKLPALRTPPPSPPRSRASSIADILPREENSIEFSQSISPHIPNDLMLKSMDPRLYQHLHNVHPSLHEEYNVPSTNETNNNNGRVSTPPLRTPPLSRSNSIDGLSGDNFIKSNVESLKGNIPISNEPNDSPVISDQFNPIPISPPNLSYGLKNSSEIELALEEMRRKNSRDPFEEPFEEKKLPINSFEDDYHSGSFKDKHLGPIPFLPSLPFHSNDPLDIVTDHPDSPDVSNRSQPIGIPTLDSNRNINDGSSHSPSLLVGTPNNYHNNNNGNNHTNTSGTSPNGGSFLLAMNSNFSSQLTWKKGQILGRGGFGNVYLGLNSVTGELFAVKQLELPPIEGSKGNLEEQKANYHKKIQSYQKEIEVMRKLNHPNIVRYLGTQFDFSDNCLYIFLEYVPGGSIHTLLSKFGPFSESVIKLYTKQILLGLEYLHLNGIIHRGFH